MKMTTAGRKLNVLIIGGGVAGLASAHALAGIAGVKVTLIEKREKGYKPGKNFAIPPYGARALKELGYDVASIVQSGFQLHKYHIRSKYDKAWATIDLESRYWINDKTPYFAIPHEELLEVLKLGPDHAYGDTVNEDENSGRERPILRFGEGFLSIDHVDSDTGVDVLISKAGGGESKEHFDLVIGADGRYSSVRRKMFPDEPGPKVTGIFNWRTCIKWPDNEAGPIDQIMYQGRKGLILMIPQGHGRVYIAFHMHSLAQKESEIFEAFKLSSSADRMQFLLNRFKSFKAGFVPRAIELISEQLSSDDIHASPTMNGSPKLWSLNGRVLLIGDAAHVVPPNGANGATQALEDVIALRDIIRTYVDSLDQAGTNDESTTLETLLNDFQKRREPRVRNLMKQATSMIKFGRWSAKYKLLRSLGVLNLKMKGPSVLDPIHVPLLNTLP